MDFALFGSGFTEKNEEWGMRNVEWGRTDDRGE
jgi:hypothetical protein